MTALALTATQLAAAAAGPPGGVFLADVPTGASCSFNPTTGDWNDTLSWSCGHVPTTSDQVTIGSGKTAQIGVAAHAGDLTLDGGTIQFTASVGLDLTAVAQQSSGTMSVTSGTIDGNGTVSVGAHFSKTTSGQLTLNNSAQLTLNDTAPTGTELSGGEICLNSGTPVLHLTHAFTIAGGADANPFNCGGGQIQIDSGAELDATAAGPFGIATPIQNAGTITVASGQELDLSGGLSQTDGLTSVAAGATLGGSATKNVSGGALTANGTVSGTITLTGTGTLNGSGQTASVVNTSGTVAPGTSPGTLTISGNYSQGADGTLTEEITGTTPGTQFDRLLVSGSVTLDGTLAIQSGTFTPAPTDSFKIIGGATSRTGTFATLTGTNAGGNIYSAQYDADGVTLLVNETPPANSTAPSIPSSGHPGDPITCNPGSWTGSPTFTFAWTRDGTAISGQTAQTYTIVDADLGHQVRCQVTGHNAGGDTGPVDSNALSVVAVPPANAGPPAIPSSGHPGDVIACDPGPWTGSPTFTFAWTRDGTAIPGQTSMTYTILDADVGHQINCQVTGHNSGGDTGPIVSNPLIVTIAAPANTTAPSIPASGHPGDVITCNPGTWTGSATFTFAWTRDGTAITRQTSTSYTLADADAGHQIRCRVTAHNAGGDTGPVDSNALSAIVAAPANTGAPTIPSTGHAGNMVTCNAGTWTGSPTFTFAWTRDGAVITGQTSATYTLADADAGHQIRCRVTAHNAGGDTGPADSNALSATVATPANTTRPSIPANGHPGEVITCNPGTWNGSPTFTYAWLRNGVVLAGQTNQTYTITSNDLSQQIKCRVTAHNAGGAGVPAESNALVVTSTPGGACAICVLGAASHTNLISSGPGSITARAGSILINGRTHVSGSGRITATAIGMHPRAASGPQWTPQPVALAHAVADPLASLAVPTVAQRCQRIHHAERDATLHPGVYCGLEISHRARITLTAGLYVFTGRIHLSDASSLAADGVTLYLTCTHHARPCHGDEEHHGSLELSSRSHLDLSAPGSGRFRGVAIYFDRHDTGSFDLNGASSASVDGAVYGKDAHLHLSGSSVLTCTDSPVAVGELTRSDRSRVLAHPGL